MDKFIGKNISFDFDKTIDREDIQNLARKLAVRNTIWIITRRFRHEYKEVFEVASKLGIPQTRIVFTSGRWKWATIKNMNIDYHYDDKPEEVNQINRFTKTKAILV